MKKYALMTAVASLGGLFGSGSPRAVSIPAHRITSSGPSGFQWSKRTMQRMKGKAARKNRGKNRNNG